MFCGKCGANIPDENTFCSQCGSPIPNVSDLSSVQPDTQTFQPVPVIMMAQPGPVKRTNGAAIAGFVLGIVSVCLCWVPYVGLLLGIVGLIFSIVGISKKNACGSGGGFAITGLILSIIAGLFMGSVMTLGMNTYLNKLEAAASQSAYESSVKEAEISRVNSDINSFMGWNS